MIFNNLVKIPTAKLIKENKIANREYINSKISKANKKMHSRMSKAKRKRINKRQSKSHKRRYENNYKLLELRLWNAYRLGALNKKTATPEELKVLAKRGYGEGRWARLSEEHKEYIMENHLCSTRRSDQYIKRNVPREKDFCGVVKHVHQVSHVNQDNQDQITDESETEKTKGDL